MNEVNSLFEPKIVLLIGSGKIREKVGMTSPELFENVVYNMKKFFQGQTILIDIEKEERKTLLKVPDLGVIMLPPKLAVQEAEKCAKIGVKALVMVTGGFKNEQRQQLASIRKEYGIRILGPNTIMGVINTSNGLNTTFEKDLMPTKGNISVISQSGGVGACLLDWAYCYSIGVSKFVFMGDKIDIDDVDLLQYFNEDPETKAICLYMEGIERGREFIETAQEVVKKKPILALKGGVTKEAAQKSTYRIRHQ